MSNNIQTSASHYYGLDGDRVKSEIEKYLIGGEIDTVSRLSKQLTLTLENIEKVVIGKGGDVKYCAGDNIFFSAQLTHNQCQELLDLFYSQTNLTASLGIGDTSADVYLALRFAKSTGGGKIIIWQDGQPLTLEQAQIQESRLAVAKQS